MIKRYHAHFNPQTGEYQSNALHSSNTAQIAMSKNPVPELHNLLWLAGTLHDAGKLTDAWQDYFEDSIRNPGKFHEKLNHASIGGLLAEEWLSGTLAAEMLQTAIYSHHGLKDCISPGDSSSLFKNQLQKKAGLPYEEARQNVTHEVELDELEDYFSRAQADARKLASAINARCAEMGKDNLFGCREYYLGMYERLLISLLIDADRRDTEDFMSQDAAKAADSEGIREGSRELWESCIEHLEQRLVELKRDSDMNRCREAISESCRNAAYGPNRLYRLTVPTGAGKTLSSLRFALYHARERNKKRIIYVAPYHSILDQNAEEIKLAIKRPELVLEHHCNIVLEDEGEQKLYERITEDWSAPVVVTTAVQFLNALYQSKTGNVRRMHSLCDSVIIIDEIQALPVKVTELFNLAVNFLSGFVNATVVLCTATQPLLDKLQKNRLFQPQNMVGWEMSCRPQFLRTEIVNDTDILPGGLGIGQAADYAREKIKEHGQVLMIVNTKSCARRIFKELERNCPRNVQLFHLSTSMCPEHREDVLRQLKEKLLEEEPVVCISTQLVEAGVDLSFRCVIRSLAGLDNMVQAAGRCNRHKETDFGMVYIVRMSEEAENLSHLQDIQKAQEAMLPVLRQFQRDPGSLSRRLDSEFAIEMYFDRYFSARSNDLSYPETAEGVPVSLVSLLSENKIFRTEQTKKQILKQSFKTAGDLFKVIEDDGRFHVVVERDERVRNMLFALEDRETDFREKKLLLRKLQRVTVSVSGQERNEIGNGIRTVCEGSVLALDQRYYNEKTGLTLEPGLMTELIL